MSTDWNLIELGDLGVLRFRGADAVKFLQGQVSNDVERLSAERSHSRDTTIRKDGRLPCCDWCNWRRTTSWRFCRVS